MFDHQKNFLYLFFVYSSHKMSHLFNFYVNQGVLWP